MIEFENAVQMAIEELCRAQELYPTWPIDPVHAAAIVAEESGELVQASLDATYQDLNHHGRDTDERMRKEAVQTAAMALRFLINMPYVARPERSESSERSRAFERLNRRRAK